MKQNITLSETLRIISPELERDLNPSSSEFWGIKSFDEITALGPREASEEALKAYKAGLRRTPLDEGGYWDCKYTDAGRRLLWGIMQYRYEQGTDIIPVDENVLKRAYDWNNPQAIMDRGSRINDLAQILLNQTSITPEGQKQIAEEQSRHLRERFR